MAQPQQRYLIVHPVLHTSGFGNQVGMLLQHLAVARLSGRSLVLPPIHQPTEHRAPNEPEEESHIDADGVFNLTTLSTASSTVLTTREATSTLAATGVAVRPRQLTFSSATGDGDGAPLQMQPAPLPALLAAVELLRNPPACVAGAGRRGAGAVAAAPCAAIGYCHLVSCRSRTKRACRRQRCTRSAQRLPNNYLFAHRLPPLLCGVLDDQQPGGGGDSAPVDASTRAALLGVWRLQHVALRQLRLAAPLRDGAAQAAFALGRFVAIHVRLTDRTPSGDKAGGGPSKGLNHTALPAMVRRIAPLLLSAANGPEGGGAHGGSRTTVLYIATNKPDVVRAMRSELAAALAAAQAGATAPGGGGSGSGGGGGALLLRGWYDLPAAQTAGLRGLRAALLEHELCATWARAYAGSVWSTWSNLIGARRWARGGGGAAAAAYLDVQSGLPAPACAAEHARGGWPDSTST